jgi:nucleoside phosphorylase
MSLIRPSDVILCGMPSEFSRLNVAFPDNLVLTGTAKNNLATLVPENCTRIVSMGLFGGLFYPMAIADVVLASTVADGKGNTFTCDPKWNNAVLQLGRRVVPNSPGPADPVPVMWNKNLGVVPWCSTGIMDQSDTQLQRAAIHAATGAWAMDDETYSVAVFAKAKGLPFNVFRSCSDDASETLPLAARGAIMSADGSVDMAYLIQQLETEPWLQTLDLPKIAADYYASLDTLQSAARALEDSGG